MLTNVNKLDHIGKCYQNYQ